MSGQFVAKSRRLRSTIYSSRIENQGVTSYTIYNHMLLPAGFESSLEDSYNHLKNYVQVWDVAAERQIEIKGKDSYRLVQLMTCRDLSEAKDGKCYYCPIIDENGGMINDPVILKFNQEKWWISIADSDVILFAKGLAIGKNFDVTINEPDVNIMAVQGPKAFNLLEKIFGKEILDLKFYNFKYFNFNDSKHLIARSGWSKQGGVEIYVEDSKSGLELYDLLFEAGKEYNVKPGCPHLIERIEGALLSYGNDMDINDNPFECGLGKFVNIDSNIEFLGKDNLIKIKENGIEKKLMGVKINLDQINLRSAINLIVDNKIIGEIRSAVFSPTFNKVLGIAMIKKGYFEVGQKFDITINQKKYKGEVCSLPFI
tara:strand:+ start:98 stop:1207 length:1110 start_codon:yes stop_codon:yes gene_type:complete